MKTTPNSKIKSALRALWLRSSERNEALKAAQYTCADCGAKRSVARGYEQKVEVHHKEGVLNWDDIYEAIREHLLCDIEKLECLCPECHKEKG